MVMSLYIQYHNCDQEGLPLSVPPFTKTKLNIHTLHSHVEDARGRVFLIAGVGKPRQYYLWETFEIEEVRGNHHSGYEACGTGWQRSPPQQLEGLVFGRFQDACANFGSFRCIDDLAYARMTKRFAEFVGKGTK